MQPCESQGLGQVGFPLSTSADLARIYLEHHMAGEVVLGQVLQHPPGLLVATSGH